MKPAPLKDALISGSVVRNKQAWLFYSEDISAAVAWLKAEINGAFSWDAHIAIKMIDEAFSDCAEAEE